MGGRHLKKKKPGMGDKLRRCQKYGLGGPSLLLDTGQREAPRSGISPGSCKCFSPYLIYDDLGDAHVYFCREYWTQTPIPCS